MANPDGLTVKAHVGDGMVLLGFSVTDPSPAGTRGLAGFAITRTAPNGTATVLPNRLSFPDKQAITAATTPEQRRWFPSSDAPFQKFRWLDVPSDAVVEGTYHYEVTAKYFAPDGSLHDGPKQSVAVTFPSPAGPFRVGFTRGYLSSQAYVDRFDNNQAIFPHPKTLDYDFHAYEKEYAWLGFHARRLVLEFLQECLADRSLQLDVFAYDLDEPQIVAALVTLGTQKRLRAVLDDAPLHTKAGAIEPEAKRRLVKAAGAANVVTGHFKRFSHDKIFIQRKGNRAVKVLTGSANWSLRGLYVQANNVIVVADPAVADQYEKAFQLAFATKTSTAKFEADAIATAWYPFAPRKGLPAFSVAYSPHKDAALSLGPVDRRIRDAKRSIFFAVMELGGGGPVLQDLQTIGVHPNLFSYGVTQTTTGLKLYKPGASNEKQAVITSFAYLKDKVPQPFRAEWNGGPGQVVHNKFVVVDFDTPQATVFTGSSNLATGGEESNGDNLLQITDQGIATAYAVHAIGLFDHYHFRAAMQTATKAAPLALEGPMDKPVKWWTPYYQAGHIKERDRLLFSGAQ